MAKLSFPPKDYQDTVDESFDFSQWLYTGDSIVTYEIGFDTEVANAPTDLDISEPQLYDGSYNNLSITNSVVTAMVSGGSVGNTYTLACNITTAEGLTAKRSATLKVQVL